MRHSIVTVPYLRDGFSLIPYLKTLFRTLPPQITGHWWTHWLLRFVDVVFNKFFLLLQFFSEWVLLAYKLFYHIWELVNLLLWLHFCYFELWDKTCRVLIQLILFILLLILNLPLYWFLGLPRFIPIYSKVFLLISLVLNSNGIWFHICYRIHIGFLNLVILLDLLLGDFLTRLFF